MDCERCGKTTYLPFHCAYCGHSFCEDHHVPESHGCIVSREAMNVPNEISKTNRDSHGKYLDSTMRAAVERMRKWQNRARIINSEENVLSMISELCQSLNLPDNVAETAAQVYRTSAKMKVAKSKSILGMTAATVYLACRKCGVSRTLKEVARACIPIFLLLAPSVRSLMQGMRDAYFLSELFRVDGLFARTHRTPSWTEGQSIHLEHQLIPASACRP